MVVDSARSSSIPARWTQVLSSDPRTECAARRMTRERIACGAVGVATPSTRRASDKLCHVCHRGHMCRGWGSRGHTLRGETSTTPVTHRCVRCGERDVVSTTNAHAYLERRKLSLVDGWGTIPSGLGSVS